MSAEAAPTQHYKGSCHCGEVTFEADMAPLEEAMACNCSICSRAGYLLAFIPEAQFKLNSGEAALSDYQFGAKHLHHTFCKVCGVRPFSSGAAPDGTYTYAINVRCLEGVDIEALKVNHYDGASR